MLKKQVVAVLCSFVFSSALFAQKPKAPELVPGQAVAQDKDLIQAVFAQKRVNFLVAKDLVVSSLLADDTHGSPHQKFNVKLSNGRKVMVISNLDLCPKVPVQVGDVVDVAGQFIPTGKESGLLHWVHKDPRKNRPDGYIELNGQKFCD